MPRGLQGLAGCSALSKHRTSQLPIGNQSHSPQEPVQCGFLGHHQVQMLNLWRQGPGISSHRKEPVGHGMW